MRCTEKKALAEALKRGQSIGPQVVKVLRPEDVFTKSFVIKSHDGIVLLPKSIEFSKGKVTGIAFPLGCPQRMSSMDTHELDKVLLSRCLNRSRFLSLKPTVS